MPLYRATHTVTGVVVEYDEPQPRAEHLSPPWRVESVSDAYVAPDAPPPTYGGPWTITRLAFRSRFTAAEKVAIEMAALDDAAAPAAQRQMAASLRVYLADIQAASYVDLQRPDTRGGVQQLETFGLIGVGRAAEILDTPPTDAEVWRA